MTGRAIPRKGVPMIPDSKADLVISPRVSIPAAEFAWSYARGSGPGGQNVNKVNSKAVLRWSPGLSTTLPADVRQRFLTRYASRMTEAGELILTSDEHRDQPQNVRSCLDRLREMIQGVLRPPRPRKPTKPTAGSHRRRLATKQQRSETKRRRQSPGREE
jgi:ribosome-associated protein